MQSCDFIDWEAEMDSGVKEKLLEEEEFEEDAGKIKRKSVVSKNKPNYDGSSSEVDDEDDEEELSKVCCGCYQAHGK